ncbi:unnamed protein product [marine sediment metagenome]|uniref:Uncharacterized protein n=1 Tax=marine sediment metagenome TaxID=412755 RepID=X1GUB9_9ZZZZ
MANPVAVAARLQNRKTIFAVDVDEEHIVDAREALRKASSKMPLRVRILEEKLN